MSGAIVCAIRCHFLHWFIPRHSPLKPCLFAIQSTLSCASAWEFSVLSFEQPAVSSPSNAPNPTMQRKNKMAHRNKPLLTFCPWRRNSLPLFPQEKILCSNLETHVQAVKYIYLWHLLNMTHQAEATLLCGGMRGLDCIHPQMALSETSLINMSVRECYAPERTTLWKHSHHSRRTFLSVRFNVFARPLMEAVEENGEEYFGEAICFTGSFFTAPTTNAINHFVHSRCMTCIKIKRLCWPFWSCPIIRPHCYHCSVCIYGESVG